MFNQCSYASVKCWSKLIYGEDLKKKPLIGCLIEFFHKRRHLISQIRLKFGQQEGKKVRNFVLKFVLNFPTSLRSSRLHWQLCNQIAKFVANFGNSEQTSEPVRQKLCETLCNELLLLSHKKKTKGSRSDFIILIARPIQVCIRRRRI